MQTVTTVGKLRKFIDEKKISPLGLVPTMGALHGGHISLVKNAVSFCPRVVVSIYVNPEQFNDINDLKNYPRTLDRDTILLQEVLRENDLVFTPDDKVMYPKKDKRIFYFGNLDKVMEAVYRPGHFSGVAKVVSRLFDIVQPDFAFFGQKDFQQLAVIKELVKQTGSRIKIIGHPIIREKDGLAMSSRNSLLDPEIRKNAGVIYSTISGVPALLRTNEVSFLKDHVKNSINKVTGFMVEYFEIVDDIELKPVIKKSEMKTEKKYFGCIAVKAGKIRLIDNIEIPCNQ